MRALFRFAVAALAAAASTAGGATYYVATDGSDSAAGSAEAPFATVQRALSAPSPTRIVIESGQYVMPGAIAIPAGCIVEGARIRTNSSGSIEWQRDVEPTYLLFTSQAGTAAITVAAGAQIQFLTVAGGYYSAELLSGATAFECDFLGGAFSAVMVRSSGGAANVDRCRIEGGSTGIRVEGQGSATITETLIRRTVGRGIYVATAGTTTIERTVVQNGSSDGAAIFGASNTFVRNSVFRRNASAGLRIGSCSPTVTSCVFEQNQEGAAFSAMDGGKFAHNTVARNRASGISLITATPDIASSIIALNGRYGIEESGEGSGGAVVRNLFHGNASAAYYDEGETPYSAQADLNAALLNSDPPSANAVADPLFAEAPKGDYRLLAASPAIDKAPQDATQAKDADNNARLVDVPAIGNDGLDSMDLGAFEFQNAVRLGFGTEWGDELLEPDPYHPGEQAMALQNAHWYFTEASPFLGIIGRILPGRLRFSAAENGSYGSFSRRKQDLALPSDKIAVARVTMAGLDPVGQPTCVVRFNKIDNFEQTHVFTIDGLSQNVVPPFNGRTYELIFDMRQGGRRGLPSNQQPQFPLELDYDLIDFRNQPRHTPQELRRVEVDYIDRATYDAQFTQTAQAWNFSAGAQGWYPALITDAGFALPVLRLNSGQGALEIIQTADYSYGTWFSPKFKIAPNKLFRVDFRISSPEPIDRVPSMRLRLGAALFDFSQQMVVYTPASSPSSPTSSDAIYSIYGRIPATFDPQGDLELSWDLWGFVGPQRFGSLFLKEVTVRTN